MAIINTPLLGLPYAGADTDETYAVLAGLFVKNGQKLTLPEIVEKYTPTIGTVYIKAADWTAADGTADAYDAKITISGVEPNSMILIYPATDSDAEKSKRLGIRAKAASGVANDDTFVIVRATGGDPTVTEGISLVYIALRGYAVWSAGLTPPGLPYATVIGVDPYIATEEGDRDDIAASQRLVTEAVTALRSTLSTLTTGLADTNRALDLRLKSADLPSKLDEYRAAKGLIDKTVSDLVNYYTKSQTLTKDEINALVSAIPKFKIEVVTSLPTSNISDTTVYLVKGGNDDSNLYTEYIRANSKWEKLGTQTVDLTGYATEAWVNDILAAYAKTVDMETYVTGLLNSYLTKEDAAKTYQPTGDYLTKATAAELYQPQEAGKGLSTNDYTNSDKAAVTKATSDSAAALDKAKTAQKTAEDIKALADSGDLDGKDGYTPIAGVDYPTDAQIDTKIAAALAERNQLEPLVAESADWLNENGDPTKVYIVPNADGQGGKVYAYAEKTVVMEDKNVIPDAICGDDQTVGWVEGKGYSENRRLSSNGIVNTATAAGAYTTGFVSCSDSDTVTVEHIVGVASGTSCYFIVYDSTKTKIATQTVQFAGDGKISTANTWLTITDRDTNSFSVKLNTLGSGIQYFRFTSLSVENLAAYINKGSGNVAVVADWYAFTDFIPTEDARIEELDQRLSVVESGAVGAVDMRTWDKPVYDTALVVLIGDDTDPTKAKPAVGDRNTVQAVYDAYDALMADHPRYITRTPYKYTTADGQTLYRYDIQAPKPHEYSGGGNPDIVKPKIILISGIHHEMVGIWSLFHALEEIMTNPELRDIKRNAHLIVVPVCNPYCISGPYSETNYRKNANGVEIHRNFAVEHVVIDSASNNYGGPEPLSEIESQHIDSILAANTDAVAFISCHNFDPGGGSDYGTSFMWASAATNYLYNLGGRFGVKMSEAWEDKYGDTFRANIDANKTSNQPDGDYTVGMAGKSTTPGTEAKQCLLYGIQGMTFEVGGDMVALGGAAGDSVTVTRGAEVYANLIRTLLAAYNIADKKACKYQG